LSQYYYVVASLPLLAYDMEKPYPVDAFVALCGEHLSDRDRRLLAEASLNWQADRTAGTAVLADWWRFDRSLRNELVKLRAARRGEDAERHLQGETELLAAQETARNAFSQESPLQAEELLNRAGWSRLDELELGHYFDLEKLIVYYLRLQILERKKAFTPEKGTENFQSIYQSVTAILDAEAAPTAP
jgi:hypothetical protein